MSKESSKPEFHEKDIEAIRIQISKKNLDIPQTAETLRSFAKSLAAISTAGLTASLFGITSSGKVIVPSKTPTSHPVVEDNGQWNVIRPAAASDE